MTKETIDEALWNFCVDVYARDGVQEECFALQDRLGADVNLVLAFAYLGAIERAFVPQSDISDAISVVQTWNTEAVEYLRSARKTLKLFGPTCDAPIATRVESLRKKLKEIELDSERIELSMLAYWTAKKLEQWPRGEADKAVAANISATLDLYTKQDRSITTHQLIKAALNYRMR